MSKKTATRPYEIVGAGQKWLVRAANPSQAVRFVTKSEYAVSVPTADRVYELAKEGVVMQDAGDPDTLPLPLNGEPA